MSEQNTNGLTLEKLKAFQSALVTWRGKIAAALDTIQKTVSASFARMTFVGFERKLGGLKEKLLSFGTKISGIGSRFLHASDIVRNALVGLGNLVSPTRLISGLSALYGYARQTAYVAEQTGFSIGEVSRFQNLLGLFGGSVEDTASSLLQLRRVFSELETTNVVDAVTALRVRLKGLTDTERTNQVSGLGIDNPALLRLLRISDERFNQLSVTAGRFWDMNERGVQSVEVVQSLLARIKLLFSGMGYVLADAILPYVESINHVMENNAGLLSGLKGIIHGIVGLVAGVVQMIYQIGYVVGAVIGSTVAAVDGLYRRIVALGQKIGSFIGDAAYHVTAFVRSIPTLIQKAVSHVLSLVSQMWDELKSLPGINWLIGSDDKKSHMLPMRGKARDIISSYSDSQTIRNEGVTNNTRNTFHITVQASGDPDRLSRELGAVIRQNATGVRP